KACPQCGHRFTSGFVKFIAWSFGIFFLLVVMIAVVDSSNTTQSASTSTVSTPAASPAPAKPKTPAEMVAARKAYAKIIDQQLLNMGIESKTYTNGADAKTLVIEDALAGRVRQNSIQKNDDLFNSLRTLGFKHLEYTNNFEGDLNFNVVWTIKP